MEVVSEERDLGVRITNDLKASAHCAYVSSKANGVLDLISRTMVYQFIEVLTFLQGFLKVWRGLIWSTVCQRTMWKRLERVQSRFTRMHGTGVEGFGVWVEVGEVEVDESGEEKKSFGSG